jgi:hypothetical protein
MAATTIILALALVMVVAEDFHQLPETLQMMSSVLMLHRNRRTAFICCVVILMSAASSVSLVVSSDNGLWLHYLGRGEFDAVDLLAWDNDISEVLSAHHLAQSLMREESYTSTPPLCLHGRIYGELYLFTTFHLFAH